MFRIFLAVLLAAIPVTAMAQSPWGSGSPTYVSRGAQLPQASRTEYVAPIPTSPMTSGTTLFAVDYTTPISSEVFAAEIPGTVVSPQTADMVISQEYPSMPIVSDANWAPVTGCSTCYLGCCNIPKCAWIRYEQLLWSLQGGKLPPLVTTAPIGTDVAVAGAIGAPGTQVLFGDKRYLKDHRNGYRVSAGGWLTDNQVLGIEASYFSVEGDETNFNANGGTIPVLASSPFLNTLTGQSQRVLIAYPGVLRGSTSVDYEADRLYGFDILARILLSNQICGRLDALVGYRQINYGESLAIRKTLVPDPNGPVPVVPGSYIQCDDLWNTSMNFHGIALGLNWEVCCGSWYLNARPKVTIGQAENTVDRGGFTNIVVPGTPTQTFAGGTYNLASNLGTSTKMAWTAVPELDLQVGYNVGRHVRVFAGYSFMYLPQVARAGNQVDQLVNTDLIPPSLPTTGPAYPSSFVNRTGMFVQGGSIGFEVRY